MAPSMIFHAPYPLNPAKGVGSAIHPVKMYQGFLSLGYEVTLISGNSSERKTAIKNIKTAIRQGKKFDFCFCEASTMPMTMNDPHHFPLHPFLDFNFFSWLQKHNTPTGLFLPDIYWLFPVYKELLSTPKRQVGLLGYAWDIWNYRRCLDLLFLPSKRMTKYLKLGNLPTRGLAPGHDVKEPSITQTNKLNIFYVGGISNHYRLEKLFSAVTKCYQLGVDIELVIVCRKDEWEKQQIHLNKLLSPAIKITHGCGDELLKFYRTSNIAALFVEPTEYWTFASPVKQYEYIGHGKPILASEGTLPGDVVTQKNIGWTLPYDVQKCVDLFTRLANNPSEITAKTAAVIALRDEHTWAKRAEYVAQELKSTRRYPKKNPADYE